MDNKINNKNYFIFGTTRLFFKSKENFLKKTNKIPRGHMAHSSNTAITQIKAAIYSNQRSFAESHTNKSVSVVTVIVMSKFKNQDALIHNEIAKCKDRT